MSGQHTRDDIAVVALHAILIGMNMNPERARVAAMVADADGESVTTSVAKQAVELASALIAELEKTKP